MALYQDIVTKKVIGSDIVRVYSGAIVDIYANGTATLIESATADNNGTWSVTTLTTGIYDIKVDGVLIKTIHFVEADHKHSVDETITFFVSGALSADFDASNTQLTFATDVAGAITKVRVQAHYVDATGNAVVHILHGTKDGASNLTVSSDSDWNHQINPGVAKYRYFYVDTNPGINLVADEILQLGIDHTATSIQGLTVILTFRPTI